ncbi:MAG: hypothetical protein ACLFRU_05020 [Paracoccaceae bacterium]
MTGARFQPGDVVEITCPGGFGYVHLLHKHPSYPPAVRCHRGLHRTRAADPAALVREESGTVALLPLATILTRLDLPARKVAELPVQESFPRFRMAIRDPAGRVLYWWFWDGDTLSYSADPAEAESALPLRKVTSGERFLELVEGREPTEGPA